MKSIKIDDVKNVDVDISRMILLLEMYFVNVTVMKRRY